MLPFKFAASQAKCIFLYKNLRTKVQKFCANIYFNQQCLKQGIIPKYAQIKVPYTSRALVTTQKKMQTTRIRDKHDGIPKCARYLVTQMLI